jgi:hypothetical protein
MESRSGSTVPSIKVSGVKIKLPATELFTMLKVMFTQDSSEMDLPMVLVSTNIIPAEISMKENG